MRTLLGKQERCIFHFLDQWRRKAKRSRLEHMKRAADTIEAHREGILNYFVHRITNALAEGFNSRIQQIKAAARGFFLGALNLAPSHGR